MFEKFSRSWELVKASASVLRSDKELMLFPILSGIATLAVLATFLVPMLALRIFADGFGIGGALFGFLFYFCQYTVIIFFNCALVGAAMIVAGDMLDLPREPIAVASMVLCFTLRWLAIRHGWRLPVSGG